MASYCLSLLVRVQSRGLPRDVENMRRAQQQGWKARGDVVSLGPV